MSIAAPHFHAEEFVPDDLAKLANVQTAIPTIAKDAGGVALAKGTKVVCHWLCQCIGPP